MSDQQLKWSIRTTPDFNAEMKKVDRTTALRVLKKLRYLATLDDPTGSCKALTGPLGGLWRARVGDWRVILDVQKGELVILALDLGHRSEVYRHGTL